MQHTQQATQLLNQNISGLIPGSSCPHVVVFLSKVLNHKLPHMAAPSVYECMGECDMY